MKNKNRRIEYYLWKNRKTKFGYINSADQETPLLSQNKQEKGIKDNKKDIIKIQL